MSVYTVVFSPTGGTKKAADCLANGLEADMQEIDLAAFSTDYSKISLNANDICIVAVPSFGGRVPAPAAARLAELKANGAKAILEIGRAPV